MLTGAGLTDLQDMMVSLSARWWRGSAVTGEAPCEGARNDPDAQPARAWMLSHITHALPKCLPRRSVPQPFLEKRAPRAGSWVVGL